MNNCTRVAVPYRLDFPWSTRCPPPRCLAAPLPRSPRLPLFTQFLVCRHLHPSPPRPPLSSSVRLARLSPPQSVSPASLLLGQSRPPLSSSVSLACRHLRPSHLPNHLSPAALLPGSRRPAPAYPAPRPPLVSLSCWHLHPAGHLRCILPLLWPLTMAAVRLVVWGCFTA